MAGTQTTPSFRCGGLAAAVQNRSVVWEKKKSATPPHAVPLPHRMNRNHTHIFSMSAISAVAAAAPHPYRMYRLTVEDQY